MKRALLLSIFNIEWIDSEVRYLVKQNNIALVEKILKSRHLRDQVDPGVYQSEPLLTAARLGFDKIVGLLIDDDRVDILAKDCAALQSASQFGHARCVQHLLSAVPRNNTSDKQLASVLSTCIDKAVKHSHLDVAIILLNDERFLVSFELFRPVFDAEHSTLPQKLRSDFRQILVQKLSLGQVESKFMFTKAIAVALHNGDTELVRLFLKLADEGETRINVSIWRNFFTRIAAQQGHEEILMLLMQRIDTNPSDTENAALRYAAEAGKTSCVRLLIIDARVLEKLSPSELEYYRQVSS